MAKQGDKQRCFLVRCDGSVTWHEKLKIDLNANPKIQPSGMVNGRPDPDYAGWLCDTCGEVFWDKP